MIWVWGIVGVILAVLLFCWWMTNLILFPETFTPEESFAAEVASGHLNPQNYQRLPKEEVTIDSPFGYKLFGLYFPNGDGDKIVIISHGITRNAIRSLRYMAPFYRCGLSVLCIEHRNHGRSGGTDTSYGHYEKHDLQAWFDWVFQLGKGECIVGVHGESMGAAIAILHAAIDPRVAFIVSDCSYASIIDQFKYRLKVEYHLPSFPFVPLAGLICHLRTGFRFGSAAPLKVIPQLNLPILFIHGVDDAYIPVQASRAMFEAKPGIKLFWQVPNSKHAESQTTHLSEYDQRVGEFLQSIGIL